MNIKTTALRTAMMTALGSILVPAASSAALVPDGGYQLVIVPNPGTTSGPIPGADGAWESTFTFGGKKPNAASQGMFNVGPTTVNGVTTGVGDAYAGVLNVTVTGGTFNVTSLQVDPIFGTAGGTFIQYASTGNTTNTTTTMHGTIDQATGAMVLDPTGRLGAVSSFAPLVNERWNVDTFTNGPSATTYQTFSTGSATTINSTQTGNTVINGAALTDIGDVNGDGIHDFSAVLVSGGQVGKDWGTFLGASYLETWRVRLLSNNAPSAGIDTVSTPVNTAIDISVLANDSGTPPLSVTNVTAALHGGATIKAGTSNTVVTYTPTGGYNGPDTFTYTVQGGNGKSATGTVNITVQASGIPIAKADSGSTLQNTPVTIDVLANDVPNGGKALNKSSVTVGTGPAHGSITKIDSTTGAVSYTPTTGYVGQDSFTYTVSNMDPTPSNPATVKIDIVASALTSSGSYGRGSYASDTKVNSANGFLTDADLTTLGVPKDDTPFTGVAVRCAGGCYDFQVTGVTNGAAVNIVLPPLSAVIATDSRYRKFIAPTAGGTKVWVNFDTSNSIDKISSAPKDSGGGCPLPASLTWIPWTGATPPLPVPTGHQCVRLTITDGGPNDDDHSANGTIVDLGGVGSGTAAAAETIPTPSGLNDFSSSSGGGCTITDTSRTARDSADWWLVGGFIAWLGMVIRRKRTQ